MRQFFSDGQAVATDDVLIESQMARVIPAEAAREHVVRASARIAVYDSMSTPPAVREIAGHPQTFIEELASTVYTMAREAGGSVPFTVIREISENLVHADFREVVVSILDGGRTLRFTDQGPGIPDKALAIQPGFTTASASQKRFIKGVGSGLPIVHECMGFAGGVLQLEDNLDGGTVVTLKAMPNSRQRRPLAASDSLLRTTDGADVSHISPDEEPRPGASPFKAPRISDRQKRVLFLAMECGVVGPAAVARELGVALSTAYRDLEALETAELVCSDGTGKRRLSERGVEYLDGLFG